MSDSQSQVRSAPLSPSHLSTFLRLVVVSSLLTMLLATDLPAQEPDEAAALPENDNVVLVLEEQGQRRRIRLAMPDAKRPATLPLGAREAAEELENTLRQDLELTGIFNIQGQDALQALTLTGQPERDFEQYRSVGNEVVLLSELKIEDSRLILEGRMYDLASRSLILGKRYRGTYDLARRIAHRFTDEIVLFFTGRRGIAQTAIAFTSDRDGDGIKELYLMDYDGFDQRRITGHRSLTFSPAWSPQSDGLAYVSYFEGAASLYWVDRDSGKKSSILVDDRHSTSPTFSPDGRWLAFSRSQGGNFDVYKSRTDGSSVVRLTSSAGIDTNPAWSPTGRSIAFTSSRSGTPQIYMMDTEGGEIRRLSFEGKYNDGAAWHPEGTRIAFARRAPSNTRFDIAVIEVETGEERLLTTGPGSHEAPSFSPDGRFIAFESTRDGSKQIYLMSSEGQIVKRLTSLGESQAPSWSNYLN